MLEIGCGEGRLTQVYAGQVASALVIDPDAAAIATARARLAGAAATLEFRVAGATEVQLPSRGFDIALLSWSL